MPSEHFSRHLRVTRLIGSDQSKRRKLPKKKECGNSKQQDPVSRA
jgi:hypothetical protein